MSKRARPGNPRTAVSYFRVSTNAQQLGPEAQRAAVADFARREGLSIVSGHVDQGISGGSDLDARPALAEAIGALRAHGAGVLLVAKRDRLARDIYVAAAIERAVAASGARVVSADGTGNGETPADVFMRSVLDSAAAYERALIRGRTRAALQAKRARGERAGTVPYGYRVDADGRTLVADPVEQAVLSRVRDLRAAGMSIREIVVQLAALGLMSRVRRCFAFTQVRRMLAA
jgi:DNA invertase Pin-like site-specific DNA recombinase